MRAIPEHLRGVFMTRRYTNPHLALPYRLFFQHLFKHSSSVPRMSVLHIDLNTYHFLLSSLYFGM